MSTLQSRVSRGIPAGGQFAATEHSEPHLTLVPSATDPAILANLNRTPEQVPLTEEQEASLRRRKTPIKDAAARKGLDGITVDMTSTNAGIRGIQDRLNNR